MIESSGDSPLQYWVRAHAIIRLLHVIAIADNEARSIESALQTCLDQVCAYMGWPVGHAFLRDQASDVLRSSGVWHLEDAERYREFQQLTQHAEFRPGVGL